MVVLGVPRRRRYISAFSETLALTVIQVRTHRGTHGVPTIVREGCSRSTQGVLTGPTSGYSHCTHGGPCPQAKGVAPLVDALVREPEDHIKSASAWSLGQIGRCVSTHEYPLDAAPRACRTTRGELLQPTGTLGYSQ